MTITTATTARLFGLLAGCDHHQPGGLGGWLVGCEFISKAVWVVGWLVVIIISQAVWVAGWLVVIISQAAWVAGWL